MIKGIIFDLDDTLYPEKEFVISGFKSVANYLSSKYNLDFKIIFNILNDDFKVGLRKKNFNVLLEKLNIKDEKIDKLISIYRDHKPDISLYKDAKTTLKNLKKKFKMGLITDGYITTQKNKILALGIEKYFDCIIINKIGKMDKRNQKSFNKMSLKLKIDLKNILYVGDNPKKDFMITKKIGITTIRIKRKDGLYTSIESDVKNMPDYTISNLLQLVDILFKLNKHLNYE